MYTQRLTIWAFIETPYRKVKEGKVDLRKQVYLSAEEEDKKKIAQANADLDDKGFFADNKVKSRLTGDFPILEKEEVEYMDVAPNQIVGLSASMIPFLEHDDANRALMGSNMQRQGVPLLLPETPIVGTGIEAIAARDARILITAEGKGTVEYVDAEEIHVRYQRSETERIVSFDDDLKVYNLTKFERNEPRYLYEFTPLCEKRSKSKTRRFLNRGLCNPKW